MRRTPLPKGVNAFRQAVVEKLDAEQAKLTPLSQELFRKLFDELLKLAAEVGYYVLPLDNVMRSAR
jgi:hypothetical protein